MESLDRVVDVVAERSAADVELGDDGHGQPRVAVVLDHEVVLEEVGARLHRAQEVQHVASHVARQQHPGHRAQAHADDHVDEEKDERGDVGRDVRGLWFQPRRDRPYGSPVHG